MNFMKRAGFVLTCATMLANLCAAQNTERTPQGMKCTTQGMDIRVEFYSPSIVRVYKTPEGKPYNKESLVVVKSPETVKVDFSEEAGQTEIFYIESSCQSGNRRHQFPYHRRQRAAERQGLRHLFCR